MSKKVSILIFALSCLSISLSQASIFEVPNAPATINHKPQLLDCDIAIAGGGIGGTTAAITAAREGQTVCLFSETKWLGGMLTSAGVSAIDGAEKNLHGIFLEFTEAVRDYYKDRLEETSYCAVSYLCFEPAIGNRILKQMVAAEPNITLYYDSSFTSVFREKNTIRGFRVVSENIKYDVYADITIDATDWGDLISLGDIPHDLGPDKNSTEPLANKIPKCIQPITHTAILEWTPRPNPIDQPENYDQSPFNCSIPHAGCPESNTKFSLDGDIFGITKYAALPNNKILINIPSHSYGNDFDITQAKYAQSSRAQVIEAAKAHTLNYIYYLQTVHGMENWQLSNDFGTKDKLAQIPYVRESRRIKGIKRLTENDVATQNRQNQSTSIATGSYPIDLHFCEPGTNDIYKPILPYQIPYEVLVPKDIDGFLAGTGRNISVSHIVNGTTRLQQVESYIGQAAGTAASIASKTKTPLKDLNIKALQAKILVNDGRIAFVEDSHPDDENFKIEQILKIQKTE